MHWMLQTLMMVQAINVCTGMLQQVHGTICQAKMCPWKVHERFICRVESPPKKETHPSIRCPLPPVLIAQYLTNVWPQRLCICFITWACIWTYFVLFWHAYDNHIWSFHCNSHSLEHVISWRKNGLNDIYMIHWKVWHMHAGISNTNLFLPIFFHNFLRKAAFPSMMYLLGFGNQVCC